MYGMLAVPVLAAVFAAVVPRSCLSGNVVVAFGFAFALAPTFILNLLILTSTLPPSSTSTSINLVGGLLAPSPCLPFSHAPVDEDDKMERRSTDDWGMLGDEGDAVDVDVVGIGRGDDMVGDVVVGVEVVSEDVEVRLWAQWDVGWSITCHPPTSPRHSTSTALITHVIPVVVTCA
jgi:hypothetical protein